MPQHISIATYKSGSKPKTAEGQSGNQPYASTNNKNAQTFLAYLNALVRAPVVIDGKLPHQRQQTEKKSATTCSEPKAIYKALCNGANPSDIHIKTTCDGKYRPPCSEFCSQYITTKGYLDWSAVSDNSMTLDEYQSHHNQKIEAEKKENRQKEIDKTMSALKGNPFAALALLSGDSSES